MRKYTTDEYIAKCREVWGDTYDLSNVVYKNSKEKVTVICHNKDILGKGHGKFYPLAGNFIRGHGCPYCFNKATSKELFVEKAKEKHNNKYIYNNVNFINSKEKVFVTCPIHGDFKISPNNHLKGEGCPKCSKKHRYTNEEIVNILKEIHGDKYDYSKVEYVSMKKPVKLICPKHGEFEIKPISAIHQKSGCIKCGYDNMKEKQKVPIEKLIDEFKEVHGDKYDYSFVNDTYINARTPVKIFCKKHNFYFMQTPDSHKKGVGCPKCNESKLENDISELLNENSINNVFQKQIRTKGRRLRIDYFLPEYNIAIECQGIQHFKQVDFGGKGEEWSGMLFKNTIIRDKDKYNYCVENGIDIIYYTNKELFNEYCKNGYFSRVFHDKKELLDYINSK